VDLAQREQIRDDLKGAIKGEVLFDELSCVLYSTDASLFEVRPLGVVVPRDEEDVQTLVRFAGENQLPLVPRGAGTGLSGEAVGPGIVVDFSPQFRRILEMGPATVRVQAGVVYRELAGELAAVGRRLGAEPPHEECTIGGMIATNACGARACRHGYVRDYVTNLRVVLDSGDVATVHRHPRWATTDAPLGRLDDIVSSVFTLVQENAGLIHAEQPRTPFDRCGYQLRDVLHGEYVDLAKLLTGSEGTLALYTEARLRTVALPAGRAVVLLCFSSLESALAAGRAALAHGLAACELIDRRLLTLARANATVAALVPPITEAVLLVEFEADSPAAAADRACDIANRCRRGDPRALLAQVATDAAEIDRYWAVREAALSSLYGLRGAVAPLALVEDVGVPIDALPTYLHRVQEVLQRHETTASYLVHAATGQVHMRPFLDLEKREDAAKLWPLADEVYSLVLELGGTISTRHGTGLARTPWVNRQYPRLYPVFRKLKSIFDPRHLFNPGKIVGPAPGMPAWPLRRREFRADGGNGNALHAELEPPRTDVPLEGPGPRHLRWQPGEVARESHSCNGCGQCRTEITSKRMCPIYRATRAEAATPRAKANLIRHLLHPDTDPKLLSDDQVRAVADLCVNCKMCAMECPAHIAIPKLMLEAKAANVAEHGLNGSDWVMARTESFARVGSALAPLANEILANPVARWLLERVFGISRQRRLPAFHARSFLRQARRRGWTRRPRSARPRVAYFVDIFANYNDPLIAEAVVAVLHHNGVEVYVPPDQIGCGMAPLASGDVETAREVVQSNLHALADVAREGYPILCSEPTAALMLRYDALDVLDDPDARLVAGQTVEATAYLWDMHQQGQLRTDFGRLDISVGHHVPCHLKALGRAPVGPALLSLIPGLRVQTIDVSCSGMAGTFGLKASNHAVSLEAGRPMLEELVRCRASYGSTECSSCRLQMEDACRKRTLHPVQYLALAYGFLPELNERLRKPIRKLVVQ
jgi:FAD/FMN-containing dehydrogenase/Fe-S oxidoreductase